MFAFLAPILKVFSDVVQTSFIFLLAILLSSLEIKFPKSLSKISNIRYFYFVIVKVLAVECLFNFLKFKQKVIYILS